MKLWQYVTSIVVGVACVVLSLATVVTARSNATLQGSIQLRQQQLNSGILGPQGQQVAGNILQEMATVAVKNPNMRRILTKYGYTVASPSVESPAQDLPDLKTTTTTDAEAVQE